MQATNSSPVISNTQENKPTSEMNIVERNNEWLMQRKLKNEMRQAEADKREV